VPIWAVAALIAAQIAINVASQPNNPICRIDVQGVHQSEYSKRTRQLSEAKVKVVTDCDAPQEKTSLTVVIDEEIANKNSKVVKIFTNVIAFPDLKNPSKVFIKNITAPCDLAGEAKYLARAYGKVHLKDGRVESVSGKSKVSEPLKCRIGAK
jgi:enterochelin esterase-like enzyme